jgi:uncharacterized membrane protein
LSSRLDDDIDTNSTGSVSRRLKQEIDSWRPYAEALPQEDREVFRDMMNETSSGYMEAIDMAERGYDTEALMMSILLKQQKTINWLANLARRIQEEENKEKSS